MADEPDQAVVEETASKVVSREEAKAMLDEGAQLVDVRVDHEWEAGRIPGAAHVPLEELPERIGELDRERPVILYCRGGTRSSMAAEALESAGFDAAKLGEGIVGWSEQELPLEPEGGYVAESGEAAARIQAAKRAGREPGDPA
jgi:rhodanese-related sulfurtransferase